MGKGMKKAGIVLLTAGCLLGLIFFVIGLVFAMSDREHRILDEDDFRPTGYGSYRAYADDSTTGSSIRVTIESRIPGERIAFYFSVEDDWGWEAYDPYDADITPFDKKIELDPYSYEWEFTIEFDDYGYEEHTISDVKIRVYSTSMTEGEVALCCGLVIMPVVGIIMSITGLIMLVAGINKKKAPVQPRYPVQPGNRPMQGRPPGGQMQRPGYSQGPVQQGGPPRQQIRQPQSQGAPQQQMQPPRPQGAPQTREGQRMMVLRSAREHEKRGNFTEATRIYEQMELFDDAERCIRSSRGLAPKETDPVNVLKNIRHRGAPAGYTCPFCKYNDVVDGSKLGMRFCRNCGSPIDFDMLAQR